MKVIITGGGGFLGRHIVKELLKEKDFDVTILCKDGGKKYHLEDIEDHVRVEVGDICNIDRLSELFEGKDIVFHTAAIINNSNRSLLEDVNIRGTENVVYAALNNKIKRLIFTSSAAAIGFSYNTNKYIDETYKYNGYLINIPYYNSKHMAEEKVLKGVENGLNAVILNPGFILGPGDYNLNVVSILINIYKKKIPFFPQGGTNFIDVRDVAMAHVLSINKGIRGKRYIIGNYNMTYKEFIAKAANLMRCKPPSLTFPLFAGKILFRSALFIDRFNTSLDYHILKKMAGFYQFYNNNKAKEDLGFEPRFSIEDSIRDTFNWLKMEGIIK